MFASDPGIHGMSWNPRHVTMRVHVSWQSGSKPTALMLLGQEWFSPETDNSAFRSVGEARKFAVAGPGDNGPVARRSSAPPRSRIWDGENPVVSVDNCARHHAPALRLPRGRLEISRSETGRDPACSEAIGQAFDSRVLSGPIGV